jgi:8-hydroxy-5-deazaflavin:NADPH oxidoreductase
MKIAVLGTGMVGETIASALVAKGHDVRMGSRSATNEKAVAWAQKAGARASTGTFADAAAFGELAFLCTKGDVAQVALESAAAGLAGKVVVDVTNPIDAGKGRPPQLFVCNDDSLGERLQKAFPALKIVKSLNTINCNIMVNPGMLAEDTAVFLSGNDDGAKAVVRRVLTEDFGWKQIFDLGDITTARGPEMMLPMWLRMWGALKDGEFNWRLVRKSK